MTDATATATDPIGDSLPAILATYYDAIDGDRFEEAAATFGSDGRYAVPLPGVIETGPRTSTTMEALRAADPPRQPTTGDGTGGATDGGAEVYYKNCAAVRAAGKAPLRRGEPGYRSGLDSDGDGVACES